MYSFLLCTAAVIKDKSEREYRNGFFRLWIIVSTRERRNRKRGSPWGGFDFVVGDDEAEIDVGMC